MAKVVRVQVSPSAPIDSLKQFDTVQEPVCNPVFTRVFCFMRCDAVLPKLMLLGRFMGRYCIYLFFFFFFSSAHLQNWLHRWSQNKSTTRNQRIRNIPFSMAAACILKLPRLVQSFGAWRPNWTGKHFNYHSANIQTCHCCKRETNEKKPESRLPKE